MKHTAGEWNTSKYSNIHGIEYGIYANNSRSDIVLVKMAETQDETDANAKLIAAAPEMLEALMKIINKDIYDGKISLSLKEANKIERLIQKATN